MNVRITQTIVTLGAVLALSGLLPARQARAQPPTLVHTAKPGWTFGNVTYIDEPMNNAPNRILMVTQDWSVQDVYNNHQIGVWYDSWAGKYAICNQDNGQMPIGASFFIYNLPASDWAFTHTTSTRNTNGWVTWIDHPNTNGHPSAILVVTPQCTPTSHHNHPIGVWYDAGQQKWAILNEDTASMPIGVTFNVVIGGGPTSFTHVATASNSFGDWTNLPANCLTTAPSIILFVTSKWYGVANNHPIGVWFTGSVWAIFNEDVAAIPNGANFNVVTPGACL